MSIFLAEAFVMFVISRLPALPLGFEVVFDAFLLTVLVFPLLYLFLFKPMIAHIAERTAAEEAERKARTKAEAYNRELAEKSLYIDNILRSSGKIAIVATDVDMQVKYFNPLAEQIFGLKAGEAMGLSLVEIVKNSGMDPSFVTEAAYRVLERGRFNICMPVEREEGLRYIENNLTGIWDRTKNYLVGFLLISQDVTRERKTSEELRQKSELLEELNRSLEEKVVEEIEKRRRNEQLLVQQSRLAAMGEMMGAIAHQWRQPINSLGIMMQEMEEVFEAGELDRRYLNDTVKKTMKILEFMSSTIDDFRNFLKPSREKVTFDVKLAIKEVLALISAQLRHHDIFLRFSCNIRECAGSGNRRPVVDGYLRTYTCDDCQRAVHGYPNEFKHVMLNMIDNAKDAIIEKRKRGYMAEGEKGKIKIEICMGEDSIKIKTVDNGGGVPEHIMQRIFEPYFTTKDGKGTGIGLYMSNVIIENSMGGRIYAENIEGGACFTIELKPAEEAEDGKGVKIKGDGAGSMSL